MNQNLIAPRLGLAELQVGRGEYQAALDTAGEILKRDPGNVNAHLVRSQAFVGLQKYADSDSVLSSLLKTNPHSPEVFYQAGMSALAQGKPSDALTNFQRSYELKPINPQSLLGIVNSYIAMNKPEEAMAMLQAESKKYPNRLDIPLLMGTTAQREGKWDESLVHFNRVLSGLDRKAKSRADLFLQIANTYRLKGDRGIVDQQPAKSAGDRARQPDRALRFGNTAGSSQ